MPLMYQVSVALWGVLYWWMNEQIQIIRRITAADHWRSTGFHVLSMNYNITLFIIFLHIALKWDNYQLCAYQTFQCKMTQWHDKFHALSKFCRIKTNGLQSAKPRVIMLQPSSGPSFHILPVVASGVQYSATIKCSWFVTTMGWGWP